MNKIYSFLLSFLVCSCVIGQGSVIQVQDFESNMNGWHSFTLSGFGAFTRGNEAHFASQNFSMPPLAGSTFSIGYNDAQAGPSAPEADVYVVTPVSDWSMYDSVRISFNFYNTILDDESSSLFINETGTLETLDGLYLPLTAVDDWSSAYYTLVNSPNHYDLSSISIGFNYYDYEGDWWYGLLLDNISIVGYKNAENEICAEAISLTPVSFCHNDAQTFGTLTGTASSNVEVGCDPTLVAPDVWYSFAATTEEVQITASALDLFDLDLMVELYAGTCNNLEFIQCKDDDDILNSGTGVEVLDLTGLTIGQTYYIRLISKLGVTEFGGYAICLETGVCVVPTVTANNLTPCHGTEVMINAAGLNEVQWTKDGEAITGETNTVYTATTSGEYAVRSTVLGCTTTASTAVVIEYLPEIEIDVIQVLAVLTAEPIEDAGYEWFNCATNTVVSISPSYTATEDGEYRLKVTVGNCSASTQCFTVNNLNTNVVGMEGITLFPNPTSGVVNINGMPSSVSKLNVLDMNGRIVQAIAINQTDAKVNMNNLENGIYFIQVIAEGVNQTLRVVKQ